MRFLTGLAVGFLTIGLVGCGGGGAPGPPSVSPVPAVHSAASSVHSASPRVKTGARTAAAKFYGLYSASRFGASWSLLSRARKRQVSRGVWVKVHNACPDPGAGKSRIIRSVTVFGRAAIVTEALAGAASTSDKAEDVFNYANGHWSYSPGNLSIYHHGSVLADIAAAKAAGLCASWKVF